MALIGFFTSWATPLVIRPAGGQAARHFDFIFDAADRLRIAHGQQGADLGFLLPDEIERNLYPLPAGKLDLPRSDRAAPFKGLQQQRAELRLGRKNLPGGVAQQFPPRPSHESVPPTRSPEPRVSRG